MEVPRGKLNSSHLEKAKSRLDKFSAVMILENLNQSLDILRSRFNWEIPTEYQNKTKISKTGVNSANKSRLQGVDVGKIRELVTFDDELYAYALYLNKKHIEEIEVRGKYASTNENCENACCGKCSMARFTKK